MLVVISKTLIYGITLRPEFALLIRAAFRARNLAMQEEASERLTVLDASETTTWEEEVNGALDVAVESVDRTISSVSTLDTPTERDGNSSDAGSVELSEQHAQESQQGPLDLPTSHDSPHDGLHPSQNSQPEPPFHHDMEGISHSRSTIRSTIDNNPPSARRIPLENRIRSKIASSDTVVPIWRPYYLRRRVLTIFILVFAVSIISIETLFALSDQLHGLGKVYAVSSSSFCIRRLLEPGNTEPGPPETPLHLEVWTGSCVYGLGGSVESR